jgi:hypothetical protein
MGKNFVPQGKPHTAGNRRPGGRVTGVRVQLVRAGKWEEQKVGLTLTRQEQVANLYRQVAEINKAIAERPEGERFPSSKEADILGKLSAAIRNMEQEVGIADIISVLTGLIDWVRAADLEKAKEITRLADAYIKDKL